MTQHFRAAVIATALFGIAGTAMAQQVTEPRSIDARVSKIKLGGVIELQVTQGPTASLTLTGSRKLVDTVTTSQNGDTLTIDMKKTSFSWNDDGDGEVRAILTVPNLSQLTANGVGAATLTGFKGDSITLNQEGAGAVTLNGNYKVVKARLGGVGSMTLSAGASEQVELSLRGAGKVVATGSAKVLKADLRGVGSLDAKNLQAESVDLDLNGLGNAAVYAKQSADVSLNGMGSATVYGKPAQRTESDRGMGSVSWN